MHTIKTVLVALGQSKVSCSSVFSASINGRMCIFAGRRPYPSPCICWLKGSVERSLRPSAIFLVFAQNGLESLKITSARCFSLKCQRNHSKKSERTPPLSWRRWALAYSRDRPYNFSCLSAMSKTAVFAVNFLSFGCHLARKSHSSPAMPVSYKKQKFEQRKRIKLFDDFWMRAYWFDSEWTHVFWFSELWRKPIFFPVPFQARSLFSFP